MGLLDYFGTLWGADVGGLLGNLLNGEEQSLVPPGATWPSPADRLLDRSKGFASTGGMAPALINAVQTFAGASPTDKQDRNGDQQPQIATKLVDHGFDPQLAHSIAGDPELMRRVRPQFDGAFTEAG